MSNSATGNSANAAKNLLNQAQGFAGPGSGLYSGFQSSLGTAQGNEADLLDKSKGNISNLQSISSTGGYDPTQLTNLQSQTSNLASTGGFDPTQTQTLNQGGYDPSQVDKLSSGYDQLATTGGYTPEQAQAFVRQATEGTGATYGVLENQARNATAATGGLGTSGGLSQMARQLSQIQGQNTLNAEVGLNERQTQNKLAGLGGESTLAGQVAGAKTSGAEALARAKQAGTAQQLGLASNEAANKLSGTEAAGSQLNQLVNTQTGQVSDLGNKLLQSLGLSFGTQEQAADILAQISKNPSMFQSILGSVSGGLGGLAGAFGG